MPAFASLTPASHDPSLRTHLPFTKSEESSPRYQTLPCLSCAYQSKVFSSRLPPTSTWSRTTVARMPRITFVLWVTKTETRRAFPSCVPRKRKVVPGRSGKYLLSIRLTKSLGDGKTGIGVAALAVGDEKPDAASATIATTRATPAADAGMTIRLGTFPPPSTSPNLRQPAPTYEIWIERPMRAAAFAFIPLSHRLKNPRKARVFRSQARCSRSSEIPIF